MTAPSARRLKPCPFCGSVAVDPQGWVRNGGGGGPACDDCGATGSSVGDWQSRSAPRPLPPPDECLDDPTEIYDVLLEPCPFCGSRLVDPQGWLGADGARGPECDGCGATAQTTERWNSRREPETGGAA